MIGISDGRNVIFRTEEVEGGNGEGRIAISHLLQCPAIYIRYDRMPRMCKCIRKLVSGAVVVLGLHCGMKTLSPP